MTDWIVALAVLIVLAAPVAYPLGIWARREWRAQMAVRHFRRKMTAYRAAKARLVAYEYQASHWPPHERARRGADQS